MRGIRIAERAQRSATAARLNPLRSCDVISYYITRLNNTTNDEERAITANNVGTLIKSIEKIQLASSSLPWVKSDAKICLAAPTTTDVSGW